MAGAKEEEDQVDKEAKVALFREKGEILIVLIEF